MAIVRLIAVLATALSLLTPVWAQTQNTAATPSGESDAAKLAGTRSDVNLSQAPTPVLPKVISPMKRGDILMARKRYREAIEIYQQGVRDAAILYNKMGIAYHQLMEFPTAMQHYNQALKLDPTYSEAINNIGYRLLRPEQPQARHQAVQAGPQIRPEIRFHLQQSRYGILRPQEIQGRLRRLFRRPSSWTPTSLSTATPLGRCSRNAASGSAPSSTFTSPKLMPRPGWWSARSTTSASPLEEGFRDKKPLPERSRVQGPSGSGRVPGPDGNETACSLIFGPTAGVSVLS